MEPSEELKMHQQAMADHPNGCLISYSKKQIVVNFWQREPADVTPEIMMLNLITGVAHQYLAHGHCPVKLRKGIAEQIESVN